MLSILHRCALIFLIAIPFLAAGCSESDATTPKPAATGVSLDYKLYKSPTCGCCEQWQTHMAEHNFVAGVYHPEDLNDVKAQLGIAPGYQSCHTAVFDNGYVFEGHIPARYIRQFLDNPPEGARGLAVPGMPLGSPGMEVDDRFMAYDILLLKDDGSAAFYARIDTPDQQW
ncbi:MAG: metal-binding protein [Porticoccaceae bacterium]|nr:metal-binding protein [Porticoccaceae bacterium]